MKHAILIAMFAAAAVALAGCGEKKVDQATTPASSTPPPVAHTCSDIASVTDPKELAALKDRCGLGSQPFKPSKAKSYQ